ncbi:hypothetical protein SCAR479_09824 [Seiridium cardinale]|uniref:Uncharacterized protein n=1 Tax=Seiridium cardinale TaxID=138064 RepID=A0ABR2XIE0_9PEZI
MSDYVRILSVIITPIAPEPLLPLPFNWPCDQLTTEPMGSSWSTLFQYGIMDYGPFMEQSDRHYNPYPFIMNMSEFRITRASFGVWQTWLPACINTDGPFVSVKKPAKFA